MKLHEYQAKEAFRSYGIAVPKGEVVRSVEDVDSAYQKLGTCRVVVKAQVHAGGRGKAGGIKVVTSAADARKAVEKLLGTRLVTHQTGKDGQPIDSVYLEAGSDIDKEYYFSILLDRAQKKITLMFSTQGGMDIEEVAQKNPTAIHKYFVPLQGTLPAYVSRGIAAHAAWPKDTAKQAADMISKCYQFYVENDCSLLEINPLVLTKAGQVIPLDGKVLIDDNAAYRHPELFELHDSRQDDPTEVEAKSFDLNYVALDGNIGCMVNGAGLAMATMDFIKVHGGAPANFLDVGGGASADQIKEAFRLVLSDSRVKSVLVNIFGGIMRCDVIAQGIIAAAEELKITVPVVVRLEGTNVEKGKKMLSESGLSLTSAKTLDEGADLAVQLAKKGANA